MNDLDLMATVLDHLDSRSTPTAPCGVLEAFRELQRLAMIHVDGRKHGDNFEMAQATTEDIETPVVPSEPDPDDSEHLVRFHGPARNLVY